MSVLADAEIRRLMKFLRGNIEDTAKLSFIEDELNGEFGAEFLRESDISSYFPVEIIELSPNEENWKLKIIPYTRMRITQRGISVAEISAMFEKFLNFCRRENQIITVGAYTIFGKSAPRSLPMTLRIDIDKVDESENQAHTVTIFVGRGDASQTVEVNLIS